jgi:hypothetical protein
VTRAVIRRGRQIADGVPDSQVPAAGRRPLEYPIIGHANNEGPTAILWRSIVEGINYGDGQTIAKIFGYLLNRLHYMTAAYTRYRRNILDQEGPWAKILNPAQEYQGQPVSWVLPRSTPLK